MQIVNPFRTIKRLRLRGRFAYPVSTLQSIDLRALCLELATSLPSTWFTERRSQRCEPRARHSTCADAHRARHKPGAIPVRDTVLRTAQLLRSNSEAIVSLRTALLYPNRMVREFRPWPISCNCTSIPNYPAAFTLEQQLCARPNSVRRIVLTRTANWHSKSLRGSPHTNSS